MPRAYDRQQLTVDRDPLRQLDMSIGNLPTLTLDPAAILAAFVESIKTSTGIDLSSVDALIQSLGEVVAQFVDFLGSLLDPDTFFAALAEVITFFAGLLDRAGFLVILEEIVNFFGGLLDRAGFFDALNDVIGFFAGLLDRAGFLGVLEDVIGFFGSILDFSTWSTALKDVVDFFAGLLDRAGFLGVLEDVIGFFGSILDFSTWSGVLKDVVDFFASLLDFSTWSGVLKDVVDFFAGLLDLNGFLGVLQDVVDFFASILDFSTWSGVLKDVVDFFASILDFSTWSGVLKDVVDFFASILDFSTWSGVLKDVVDFFASILDFSTWSGVLKDVVDFFAGLLDLSGFLGVLQDVVDFFASLLDFSTWSGVLKDVVDFFAGLLDLSGFLGVLQDVVDFFASLLDFSTWSGVLKDVVDFFAGLLDLSGFLGVLQAVSEFFDDAIATAGSIANWADSIFDLDFLYGWVKSVFSDPIVRALTGLFDVPDIGALATWARDLLTGNSPLNPLNLIGAIPATLLGQVPVSSIGFEPVNLLAQGSFGSSDGVIEADGWTWEELLGRGDSRGCVKSLANGVTKTLYSTQSIPVAEDQVIETSCYITTAGFAGSATSIQLVLIPFFENSNLGEIVVAQRGGYNTTWIQMVGSDYMVPSNVTSVRIALRVTSAATAGYVLWDDVSVKKTGLMGQTLVDSLINAWEGIWTGVFGSGGLGKIWSDMESALGALSEVADTAAGNASDALGAAADADDKAVAAQNAAATADGKAVDAQEAAETADGKAVDAQEAADTADGKAVDAQEAADTADNKAVVADILAVMAGAANNMIVSSDMEETTVARGRGAVGVNLPNYGFGYSTEQARSGTQSMKLYALANFSSTGYCFVNFSPRISGTTETADGLKYAVVPGQVYNYDVEFYVTGSGTTLSVGPGFKMYNRAGQTSGNFTEITFESVANPTKNTWHRLTGTYTIPAEVNVAVGEPINAQPLFAMKYAANGDAVYIDRFVVWR